MNNIGKVSKERIIEAICGKFNYQLKIRESDPESELVDNPESKEDFADRMIEKNILSEVENYEKELLQKDSIKDYDINVVSEKLTLIKETNEAKVGLDPKVDGI
jgi:hypothetical protein